MRRIAYIFLGLALVGATNWFCSSDAPAPTPPRSVTPGTNGASALQIRLFTSNANPVAGSCTVLQAVVTLNGVNVPDGTGVAFTTDLSTSFFQQNGLPLVSVVTQGGTTTTALCSSVSGLATVRATATIGSETGAATIQIAFQPSPAVAPFFTFCSPSFGPPEGGTTLTVNGGRFFGDPTTTRATFTAAGITREALVTGVTATSVTLVTPAFPEASSPSVPVAITLTFGTKSTTPVTVSLPNCFAFGTATPATPTITAVLPSAGTNEGNTRVTIIGSGFVAPLQVFFGPVEAQVLSISFNQIIVLTPPASGAGLPNLNATVTVRVHEINSGLDATLSNAFRFVTKVQVTAADNTLQRVDQPFTPVTIHGQGFLAPVAVTIAGIPARVISVSATELLVLPGTPFLTGCTDITGPIIVLNIDSGDSATGPNFTYQVAITKPTITGINPSSGPPGTTVTISGTNLGNITNVSFGGRPAAIVSVSSGSVVVTVPDNGATPPACPAGTPAGTPLNVGTPVDVTVSSSLTTCSTTATALFQYQLPCKPGADLSIAKTASPNPVVTGSFLTYTISVNNNGPNPAENVVVSDPLPGGTNFVSCSASQGTCAVQGNSVVANLGTINSPGFASLTIVVSVSAPGDSTITNTAVVSSTTPDTNTSNNTASVTTNVSGLPPTPTLGPPGTPTNTPTTTPSTPTPTPTPTPSADLSLTKDASPNPVVSGSTLTYLLGVTNNGPNTSQGVVVTDPLPIGTTFVSCSTSQGSCLGPAVGNNGTVTANLGSIVAPGFAQVTIVVTVTAPGGQTLSNTAVVNSSTSDPASGNNIANKQVTVASAPLGADLSVVKTSSAGTVPSGGILAYTVMVHNGGPDPATGVLMTDAIPTGTTFVSCTPSQGTCSGPAVGTNGTVTANLGTMPSGSTAVVTIVVNVTAPSGSTLVNTAVVSSVVTDPNPGNNSSTNVTSVGPPSASGTADLSISKTGSPNPVFSGSNLTYSLEVVNLGPSPSDGVVVSDTLPFGTTFISCGSSQGVCAFAAGKVTANLGTVGSSNSANVTIVVNVTAPGGTTISNTGSVSSSTTDPNLSNNTSQTTTTVVNGGAPTPTPTPPPPTPTPTPTASGVADLSLSKTGTPASVVSGGTLTYQLRVTNNGTDAANGVVVTDPLPAGTVFQSCSTSQGSCQSPGVGANGTVVISFGSIPSGSNALATIAVTVTASPGSSFTNSASVSALTFDPNPSNNTASAFTLVTTPSADLSVTKTAFPNTVFTGKPLTYTIVVTNNGPNTANTVEVSDPLPAGTTFVSCGTTKGACGPVPAVGTNGTVRVEVGNLTSGSSATVTIVVTVTAPGGTTVTNTATVTSDTADPNVSNNSSSVTTTVNP